MFEQDSEEEDNNVMGNDYTKKDEIMFVRKKRLLSNKKNFSLIKML